MSLQRDERDQNTRRTGGEREGGGSSHPHLSSSITASRASLCLQHLPFQPVCSVPRGISGRLTHHAFIPSSKCLMASLKTLNRTPETYISAPHLWSITSPPPLEVPRLPRLPRLHGCRIPWKAFSPHCGPGLLEAGPHIRISGNQKPMPTGSPDPIRGSASAGPEHGPGIRILSTGGPSPASLAGGPASPLVQVKPQGLVYPSYPSSLLPLFPLPLVRGQFLMSPAPGKQQCVSAVLVPTGPLRACPPGEDPSSVRPDKPPAS